MKKLIFLLMGFLLLTGCQKTDLTIRNSAPNMVCVIVYSDSFNGGSIPNWIKIGNSTGIQDIPDKDIKIGIYKLIDGIDPNTLDGRICNYPLDENFWEFRGEKFISVEGGFLFTRFNTVKVAINSDYSMVNQ